MKTQPTYGAAVRFSRHYGYDAAGRRSYMAYGDPATNPGGQAYHYDARGQLTHARFLATGNPATAVPTTNPTHQFSFDASGNRQSAVTPALGTVNYTSNSTNAYTMVTGDQPAYDANGNATRLRGRTLAWDRKNRMRSNGGIEYIYDALGRMVQRKDTATGETHRYSWSGWLMLGERKKDSSGTETEYLRYTWGADLTGTLEGAGTVGGLLMVERFAGGSGTAQVAHVHSDANGNTMGLTSDTGAVLAWYRYHPFGTLETSGGNAGWLSWNRFTFSMKWHDPMTGLHYYGYRWYDPVAGRWPSRDPIQEKGGLNLYGFVDNDGVNYWDVLGLAWSKEQCDLYIRTVMRLLAELLGDAKVELAEHDKNEPLGYEEANAEYKRLLNGLSEAQQDLADTNVAGVLTGAGLSWTSLLAMSNGEGLVWSAGTTASILSAYVGIVVSVKEISEYEVKKGMVEVWENEIEDIQDKLDGMEHTLLQSKRMSLQKKVDDAQKGYNAGSKPFLENCTCNKDVDQGQNTDLLGT